jgi:hypothetical protein
MAVDIYINGERLDTFGKDENITVTTAVQDVKDISKIRGDFSQGFTVPASKRNNQLFKHYYNADIDNGFDARVRQNASIDVDTLDFKRGKIELVDVGIKENQIQFYKIVFYGNTIKVKDLIGEDKMISLDWLDNFNHDYTSTNVLNGLTVGLDFTVNGVTYTDAVVYPLISYRRQYLYSSDSGNNTNTDKLVNIRFHTGQQQHGVNFGELRPAIKVSLIIKAITEKYGLNFTGNFFESTNFTELYVNVNNRKDDLSNGLLVYETASGTQPTISIVNDRYVYKTTITPKAAYVNTPYKVRLTVNGSVRLESEMKIWGTKTFTGSRIQFRNSYEVKAEMITQSDFDFDATTQLNYTYGSSGNTLVFSNSQTNQSINLDTIIKSLFKDIKVYDFLTSILKMFNLVVVPDGDDLFVDDLQNWYTTGNVYDISQYIDTSQKKISKGKILNQIDFKFKESKQVLADFYYQQNNIYYGNLEEKLYTDETKTELLSGDKLDVETVFEQPIFERLIDINNNTQTTIQYALIADEDINTYVSEPFLMYCNQVDVSSNSIGFENSTNIEINTTVFMPSHSIEIDTESFNINFNAVANEYTAQVFDETIYNTYWSDYITDIFSIKRRIYNYTAILPNFLLSVLKANDRLVINGQRFLINTIKSNIVNRKDTLELINDIYTAPLASDTLNSSLWTPDFVTLGGGANTSDSNYIGLATATLSLIDTGDGTSWITITGTVTSTINTITFDVTENTSGSTRTAQIKATDGINDPLLTIIQNV